MNHLVNDRILLPQDNMRLIQSHYLTHGMNTIKYAIQRFQSKHEPNNHLWKQVAKDDELNRDCMLTYVGSIAPCTHAYRHYERLDKILLTFAYANVEKTTMTTVH